MATTARENLYAGSLPHVDKHVRMLLEERSNVPWSSQALCISVFGTIAEHPNRARLMQVILDMAGIDVEATGTPELRCEVRGRRDVLNEYGGANATCPDVLVEWPELTMTIESKFTEHLGHCGQVAVRRSPGRVEIHPKKCLGLHQPGSDLETGTNAACRLTVPENEGRRGYRSARLYWDVAERLFEPVILTPDRAPCPFADGKYQLMRNLCFAARLAELTGPKHQFAFLLAYVGGAASAEESHLEFAAFRDMLRLSVHRCVGHITYEAIAACLRLEGEDRLADWLDQRILDGLAAR